jgi:GNAT superfamily N-acetyltransferase
MLDPAARPVTSIRRVRPRDLGEVVAACIWLFEPPATTPAGWDAAKAGERLERLSSSDIGTILVAEFAGKIIGFCTVYLDLESVRFGQRAWLNDMAVDPRSRSRGTGAALLAAARTWARERGATVLQLDSSVARTDAHRFYRREQPAFEAIGFGWVLGDGPTFQDLWMGAAPTPR